MNFNQLNIGFQNNQHFLIDNNINMMNNNMNNINNNNMIQMNNNNLNMMNNNTNMMNNNMNIYNNNMNMYNNNLNMNNTNIYYNNNIDLDMNNNNVMINNNMNDVNINNMNMINNNNMNMLNNNMNIMNINNNMNIMNINNNMNMMNMNMVENIIGNITNINSDNNYIRPKNLIPRVIMENAIEIDAYPGGNNAEKINIIFASSSGLRILMRTPPNTPIKNFIRKYLEKINLGEEVLNGGLIFLINASQVDVNSDMPINLICVGIANVITVIDIQYVIGGL